MSILLLLGGLLLLVLGAEILVRGASSIALSWGVTPLVVGLTVVAFGTSAPEVAVSVRATLTGQADIALGNVIGSNLFNVLVILGLAALVLPLSVGADLVRRDIPVMIAVSVLLWLATLGGSIPPLVAGGLLLLLVGYTVWLIVASRQNGKDAAAAADQGEQPRRLAWPWALACIAGGLVLLILGAGWLVEGAVIIARSLGMSELVIGLTIVAAGTSFPELATSVVAAARGQRDIAIGNVVGSNTFNLLGVLGAAGAVSGTGLPIAPGVAFFDLPLMVGVALLCWPLCRSGFVLSRAEGAFLILGYGLYVATLIAAANAPAPWPDVLRAATWTWLGVGLLGSVVLGRPRRGGAAPGTSN